VSVLAVAATYLLIVLGAVVRASGSGLGCPDWPGCYGQPIPPGQVPAIIEYSHRVWGAVASVLILTTLILWARSHRFRRDVVLSSLGIVTLLGVQIALGAITVRLELPPHVVAFHLGMAMILLGLLMAIAVSAWAEGIDSTPSVGPRLRRMVIGATAAVFILILIGVYVRASGATGGCVGFPTCNGVLLPFGVNRLTDIHLIHRIAALLVAVHLVVTVMRALRHKPEVPGLAPTAALVGLSLLAQLGIGIWMVSSGFPPVALVLHVMGAGALWGATVALLTVALRDGRSISVDAQTALKWQPA
jgi:heme A synthase